MNTSVRHTLFEDLQALLAAPLMVALSVLMFREAGLLTGGTTGLAFLAGEVLRTRVSGVEAGSRQFVTSGLPAAHPFDAETGRHL